MSVIYYKIWSDLWRNKARTWQVVLIIAMGALAVGMIVATRNLTVAQVNAAWAQSSPPMLMLWVKPSIDEDQLLALKSMKGVAETEGLSTTSFEWRLDPCDDWQTGELRARADYHDQKLSTVWLVSGEWPTRDTFGVRAGVEDYFNIHQGSQMYIRIDDKERLVTIGGLIETPYGEPLSMGGRVTFFTTQERFGELTDDPNFNTLMAAAPVYDEAQVTDMANRIGRQLEKQDIDSGGAGPRRRRSFDPQRHFMQETLDGIFLILGLLGLGSIILGLFLNYNTISALISEQVKQIGVMKAIGASAGQILWIYLLTVLIYGLLALLIAVPLGAMGAYGLTNFMLSIFNYHPIPLTFEPAALLYQVGIALVSPLLASLWPILTGVRLTVREAISTYGLGGTAGLLDQLMTKVEGAPRLLLLTLGNTFRNKKRVVLTLLTLVSSGLLFMMVMSVKASATYTMSNEVTARHNYQITFTFEDPERIPALERLTLAQPGVRAVEMWQVDGSKVRPATQAEAGDDDESATLFGMPIPTELYTPRLVAGRWLEAGDSAAVVLHQNLAAKLGVSLGDRVIFDHSLDRESGWVVVGLLADPLTTNSANVPRTSLSRALGSLNQANTIWIQTGPSDPASTDAVAGSLRQLYERRNIELAAETTFRNDTITGITAARRQTYNIIVNLLAMMAVVIAIVGSIGLSGVLSLSVLERRREIGVMRAIGASSGHVARLFIGEGLILGLLSWLVAFPLSIPAATAFTQMLASSLDTVFVSQYALTGALYWLAIITLLSIAASWLPARSATQISVQESLAY